MEKTFSGYFVIAKMCCRGFELKEATTMVLILTPPHYYIIVYVTDCVSLMPNDCAVSLKFAQLLSHSSSASLCHHGDLLLGRNLLNSFKCNHPELKTLNLLRDSLLRTACWMISLHIEH